MTVKEQVTAWAEKYQPSEEVLTRALKRADVCDPCENNTINDEGGKMVNRCAVCGCKLIRLVYDNSTNPCQLYKFDEDLPRPYGPALVQ